MNINEEIETKRRKVDLLKLEIEEFELRGELEMHKKDTHFIDENGCVKQQLSLGDEISRLETKNQEFHETIVGLHTEMQEKDDHIKELETNLDLLSPVILEITDVVSMWLSSDKLPIGNLETISKVAGILDKHNRLLAEKHSGTVIPESVKAAVAKMQDMLNEDLPDGVEVMLKVAKED